MLAARFSTVVRYGCQAVSVLGVLSSSIPAMMLENLDLDQPSGPGRKELRHQGAVRLEFLHRIGIEPGRGNRLCSDLEIGNGVTAICPQPSPGIGLVRPFVPGQLDLEIVFPDCADRSERREL